MLCLPSALLCVSGVLAWAWLLPRQEALGRRAPPSAPSRPAGIAVPALPSSGQNLAQFYATLGAENDVEHHLVTLFALAARSGLVLQQGDYKLGYDKVSHLSTYEIVLPMKGSYQAVWRFSGLVLRAMPFAALDEISFRRDSIGADMPEARLHLTLFLQPGAVTVGP